MEKEENQNSTLEDKQKPVKETAKTEENLDVEYILIFFGNKLLISLSLPLLFVPIRILFIFCLDI